jgi:exosortase
MSVSTKAADTLEVRALNTRAASLRGLGFLLVCMLPLALAWSLLAPLFRLVLENDTFSQIPLIPLVSLFLIWERRKAIFSTISFGGALGAALIVPGLILAGVARLDLFHLTSTNPMSLLVFAIVVVWVGAFALFFGARAFWAACFPLLFLLFMVPIPEPLLSKIIFSLQGGSSDMAEIFFRIAGVPYLRQGFVFQLPGFAIFVAAECSGIRSTLALLITTVLASNMFLTRSWKRAVLCAAVVPLAIFKNGLRIATLSTLAIYVNPGFLTGRLHHEGGFVFFLIALVPLALLLFWLQKREQRSQRVAQSA